MGDLRANVKWIGDWSSARLPDADALIATAWQSAAPVAEARFAAGASSISSSTTRASITGSADRVDATYRLPLTKIVISTWLHEIMASRFGSPAEVIVTPVDPTLFHPVPVEPADGLVRVLMLHHEYEWEGSSGRDRGVQSSEGALPQSPAGRIRAQGSTARSPYDEFFENLPQTRLAWLYSRCPIYCCPSWDEGLGMPPMEAMACGAALCTYDNGGCRDYAIDGTSALVAPRRDVDALARTLARLVDEGGLRERIARQGRELIVTRFDWERATATLEALLQSPSKNP
jgi:hypothetical protein